MKNAVFWNMTPCGSCKNRRFGGMYRLHDHGEKNQRARNNVSSNLLILFTLMIEAICSSETSVLIRAIRHLIPEDGIILY
jgi:hypothetical protein